MITLGTTETKWFIASGALGFDGHGYWFESLHRLAGFIDPTQFVVIGKTLPRRPMRGNLRWWQRFGGCVRLLDIDGNPLNEWHYLMSSPRIAGTVKAVGVADGDDPFPHLGFLRVPQLGDSQLFRRVDFDYR